MDRRSLTIVGNTTSETKSRFPPIPETPGRGVTYIASGGGGMDFFKEKSMSEIFDEGPTLRKYVNKVQKLNRTTGMFKKGRDEQIMHLENICHRACKKLKINPRSRFLRQLGQREIVMKNECLSWKELNAVISVMVEDQYATSLDISGNNLNGSVANYIDQLLQRNPRITELDLSDNNFADEILPKLVKALIKSKHLRKLNIAETAPSDTLNIKKKTRKLEILYGNHFTDRYAPEVAKLVEDTEALKNLNLSHNELREKGGMVIGNALAENDSIEELDMSWNHLRCRGAECLSVGVMKNTGLRCLNLSWNGFGLEGCVALGHALTHNHTLEELDITHNRIHAPALYEFLKGLLQNKGLQSLKLGHNPIPAIATSPFLTCIRNNPQISVNNIDFTGVVVDDQFEEVLDEIHETKPNFKIVYDQVLPVHQDKYDEMHKKRKTLQDIVFNVDPVKILFYTQKNLRVVDLFHKMDRDGSCKLSRDEIRQALRKEDFNMSISAMDAIFDFLDTNGDGEIDLQEFLHGSRRLKRIDISVREENERREKLDIERASDNIDGDPGTLRGRFSSTFKPQLQSGDISDTVIQNMSTIKEKPHK